MIDGRRHDGFCGTVEALVEFRGRSRRISGFLPTGIRSETRFGIHDMGDIRSNSKLLRSLLREYVPDEKHPFRNPSELSLVVSLIKTHKLLSESAQKSTDKNLIDELKSAVDSWVNRVSTLASSNMISVGLEYVYLG